MYAGVLCNHGDELSPDQEDFTCIPPAVYFKTYMRFEPPTSLRELFFRTQMQRLRRLLHCGKVLLWTGNFGEREVNKNTVILATMLGLGTALAASPVLAQKKLYRCGSNYQDRPCEQTPAAPKPAPAPAKTEAPAQQQSKAAYQQQLRCENYARQMAELRETQKGLSKQSNMMDGQIRSLEGRMKSDNC